MATLLHIEGSPRKERSASLQVARAFLQTYRATNPDDTVATLDVWAMDLPEFDGDTINAKYRILHGQEHTNEEAAAWQAVEDVFKAFNNADKYVFSSPMWNFGIPYKLKQFIDVVTQPGLAFHFSPETGYTGLVTDKPAVVICARGGTYSEPATKALDFQQPYLETLLRFIGFTEIQFVLIEPTLGAPEQIESARNAAIEAAEAIAKRF